MRGDLTGASHCYAYDQDGRRAATGEVVRAGTTTMFQGDGASPIQTFSVDAGLVSGTSMGESGGQEIHVYPFDGDLP
ncbi:hypothetical protein [Streptomyces sp. NPDC058374]|uniref:hypothetical protein n=1 Tax=unclassified Streptomyces TaxID=2593676 RepID=UPI0036624993